MSTAPDEHLDLTIPSVTTAGLEVQEKIVELLEARSFSPQDVFGIRLSLEEALVNAIKHGNGGDPEKSVHVQCRIAADEIDIVIEDEGPGFDPGDIPDPTLEENLEVPSGRGVMLMRSFMTQVEYNDTGNRVRLLKTLAPSDD